MKTPRRSGHYWAAMVACHISTAANFWKTIPENRAAAGVSNFVQTSPVKERIIQQQSTI
jgi:hypothetical protein